MDAKIFLVINCRVVPLDEQLTLLALTDYVQVADECVRMTCCVLQQRRQRRGPTLHSLCRIYCLIVVQGKTQPGVGFVHGQSQLEAFHAAVELRNTETDSAALRRFLQRLKIKSDRGGVG